LNLSRKPSETNLERKMRLELNHRAHAFEQFYPVRSGFILDFAFSDEKLGIECDGERWHSQGNKRDRFRDWILRRGGWTILRFREKEINDDVARCVDKVESILGQNGYAKPAG
jgi:very-short-patch-repair endonuclease